MLHLNPRSASLFISLFIIATCCKILLIPSYRSTDFNVHLHWKALTHSLRESEWYAYETTRNINLDYPPAFAFFERGWSWIGAKIVLTNVTACFQLPPMDRVDSTENTITGDAPDTFTNNHHTTIVSNECLVFMRSTVIVSDAVLWMGAAAVASCGNKFWTKFILIVCHPGLLWLDHVHFQYNGFLLGILLASLACLMHANNTTNQSTSTPSRDSHWHLLGAALFAILLTLKHLYLTLGPWYFAYLLRRYCFDNNKFSARRFVRLATATATCLLLPFAPFFGQLARIGARLFPFGRGLVHDYWAANLWAVYMGVSKVAHVLAGRNLPNVPVAFVALLLFVLLCVGAVFAWKAAALKNNRLVLLSFTFSALASFLTAYHVHEKAIMTTLLPMIALSSSSFLLWETTAWGLLALFPLLFEPREMLVKWTSYTAYMAMLFYLTWPKMSFPAFHVWTTMTIGVIIGVWAMLEITPVSLWGRMEFLPLMLTSLICAVGLLQAFVRLAIQMVRCTDDAVVVDGTMHSSFSFALDADGSFETSTEHTDRFASSRSTAFGIFFSECQFTRESSIHLRGSHSAQQALPAPSTLANAVEVTHGSVFSKTDVELDASWVPPVRVVDETELDSYPFMLTQDQRQQLANVVLPKGITYCKWKRLFSIARDGDSFPSFLRRVKNHDRTLLIIKTTRNELFGGYADAAWDGPTRFYGGSTACLFRFAGNRANVLHAYPWSGANRYSQLCHVSSQRLAFGGGDCLDGQSSFGLAIGKDFQVGSTAPCATFNNEPLCEQEHFRILDMEVYGFDVGQF